MNELTQRYLKIRLQRAQEFLDTEEIQEVYYILEEVIALLEET
jgi:hypothetical protein